jgi:hypothetical protein
MKHSRRTLMQTGQPEQSASVNCDSEISHHWRWPVVLLRSICSPLCAAFIISVFAQLSNATPVVVKTQLGLETLYSDSYALIISESDYNPKYWDPLTDLPEQMKQLVDALEKLGFDRPNIDVLSDVKSTQLLGKFQAFLNAPKHRDPDARLLIYFAGHGASDEPNGYIVPVDAPPQSAVNFYEKALSMGAVKAVLETARARHTLAVFDSCFSGTIFQERGVRPITALRYESLTGSRGVFVITAGNGNQPVPAGNEFLDAFIRGALGAANAFDPNLVSAPLLGEYLRDNVKATTPLAAYIMGDSSSQFVFVAPGQIPDIGGGGSLTKLVAASSTFLTTTGAKFQRFGHDWYYVEAGSSGNQKVHLIEQLGGDHSYRLWDQTADRVFDIPEDGGMARVKQASDIAWSEFGNVQRK